MHKFNNYYYDTIKLFECDKFKEYFLLSSILLEQEYANVFYDMGFNRTIKFKYSFILEILLRLNLIDNNVKRKLDEIRKLRNSCIHPKKMCDHTIFESQKQKIDFCFSCLELIDAKIHVKEAIILENSLEENMAYFRFFRFDLYKEINYINKIGDEYNYYLSLLLIDSLMEREFCNFTKKGFEGFLLILFDKGQADIQDLYSFILLRENILEYRNINTHVDHNTFGFVDENDDTITMANEGSAQKKCCEISLLFLSNLVYKSLLGSHILKLYIKC